MLIACPALDHEERISLFTKASETDPELPYTPLLRLVDFITMTLLLVTTSYMQYSREPRRIYAIESCSDYDYIPHVRSQISYTRTASHALC